MVMTIGMSFAKSAVINNWPIPFTPKTFSVMMAPPKMDGTPSAMTVITGIIELRNTCTITTTPSLSPFARAVRT